MLVAFDRLLADRRDQSAALAAFTAYDLETAGGVLAAAEEAGLPVVLLVSRDAFAGADGDALMAAIVAAGSLSSARCCVQLDHVSDLELMRRALRLGCTALMADGSKLPYAENARLVAGAVEIAEEFGAHVESELGHVSGDEDVAHAARAGMLTEPEQAERFAADSRTACLAVSIGNAHGVYARPPELDWTRLRGIRAATAVPLSLHGASGIADGDARRAIELGISKVNINTELREAYLDATARRLPDVREGLRLLELHRDQREAVRLLASRKLALLNGVAA